MIRRGGPERGRPFFIGAAVTKTDRYLANLLELEPESGQRPLRAADVSIAPFQRTVSRGGQTVHLTPKEYAVLSELAKHPGRALAWPAYGLVA